jgi:L-ascorbate metabolism protein UlaG (beta-lactamase superfamily)
MKTVRVTLIGGPTALIEIDGFRLLTDPTFDAPRSYQLPHVKLEKLSGPALGAEAIGEVDAVLLSHDQHADNLDDSGRSFLARARRVLTTVAGAKRLGGHVEGLLPWAVTELTKAGRSLTITATPARHGPAGIESLSGDVIGFVVGSANAGSRSIYISGDTVWYDGVAEVARRFYVGLVLPFAGAAQINAADQLAFGSGPHACIGLHLAKLEMTAIFCELATRVKRFHIEEEVRNVNNTLRGFKKLIVAVEC